jgi:hypothetical protein
VKQGEWWEWVIGGKFEGQIQCLLIYVEIKAFSNSNEVSFKGQFIWKML